MKKILLGLACVLIYIMPANAITKSIGITAVSSTIDSTVKDDIDSNGTTDTTKDISNDIGYGSIFLEFTNENVGPGSLTFGIDVIPGSAEFDSRSTSQQSCKAKAAGACPQSTGTNSGTVDVDSHITLYLQPGITTSNGLTLFGTVGYVTANVEADVKSISSTNKTEDLSLDGVKLGVGIKKTFGNNAFVKLEYAQTDYDEISVTTENSTKVTADIDNTALALSIGKSF
tara:strand:- start:119 stop:805 length:687 start_codon:yes stop_codon:yes gene_type:complete